VSLENLVGIDIEVRAKTGTSLMRATVDANVRGIDAECGNCCSCATCQVYSDDGSSTLVPPPQEDETTLLEFPPPSVDRKVN